MRCSENGPYPVSFDLIIFNTYRTVVGKAHIIRSNLAQFPLSVP